MKKIIILIIIVAGLIAFFNYRTTPEDVDFAVVNDVAQTEQEDSSENDFSDLNMSEYSPSLTAFDFTFTGYGPAGKQHQGRIDASIQDEGQSVSFDMTTVKTDSEQLDEHLCNDDFFSCPEYPVSTFVLGSVNPISPTQARVSGVYTMKGISKNISFVADVAGSSENLSQNNLSASYVGQFMLDTTEFNFAVPIVDPNVLIEFDFAVELEAIVQAQDEDESEAGEVDDQEATSTEA
jgi:polyisoprenoid-binding protein YceI